MIEASQQILKVNTQGKGMTSAVTRHCELQIKTVQNAPRDTDKLERLLKIKERHNEEAIHIEDTQRLVTEIEMLKLVLYLVNRNSPVANH